MHFSTMADSAVAMVTAYYGKKFGENWRFCYFYILKHLSEILPTCWPRDDVWDTFFDNGGKCVTMVTAYQGKKMGKTLRIELLPHFLGI